MALRCTLCLARSTAGAYPRWRVDVGHHKVPERGKWVGLPLIRAIVPQPLGCDLLMEADLYEYVEMPAGERRGGLGMAHSTLLPQRN